MAPTARLLAGFFRPSKFGENKMIETTVNAKYGQVVTTVKIPESAYGTDTYVLRNRKGEHVGTLCVTASGMVTLCSSSGYKFADAPD
tara:strand:+ start:332 stop:592 length:261 start_codon:yes stop_codon:yes gene_type:complete